MDRNSDLPTLLSDLRPTLAPGEFVFITRPQGRHGDGESLAPVASFLEQEGLTLVVPKELADAAGESYDGVFRWITLQVQSSLQAVGLTAAVSNALSQRAISANVIAAYHHDHIFVPADRAEDALQALHDIGPVS